MQPNTKSTNTVSYADWIVCILKKVQLYLVILELKFLQGKYLK